MLRRSSSTAVLVYVTKREMIEERLAHCNPDALFADGFDDALVGIVHRFTTSVVAYDYEKCLQCLMDRDGMTREEAEEFFDFNVQGAWMGEGTPAFIDFLAEA